ncbi:PREDICTED: uncharacterized protein LOC109470763 [Branchiostoma belcheri]|uniref:Uncharacterized protein LOC109470763 n=1 Tax=Branchiostoma belcheri TaxID=7741 RepID=A0A6P4Z2U7_BRABE|nr:PREDICTED: uncharacterized protein LOC109470763 [Branchiostoma belcheri]
MGNNHSKRGRDRRGVLRAECSNCRKCDEFVPQARGVTCAYCDCAPVHHREVVGADIHPAQLHQGSDHQTHHQSPGVEGTGIVGIQTQGVLGTSPGSAQAELDQLKKKKRELEQQLEIQKVRKEVAELESRLSEEANSTADDLRISFSSESPTSSHMESPFGTMSPIQTSSYTDLTEPKRPAEQHMTFHPRARGKNICIENKGTTARSVNSFNSGVCFSRVPVGVGQKVQLKIVQSRTFKGSMRIGFTSKDPDTIDEEKLPSHSYPDMAQQPGFWIKPLPNRLARQGNVVTYTVDSSGSVNFYINRESKGLFFDGVDVSGKLWAVVDVHGSTMAVQLVDEQAVCDAVAKTIYEGDMVKLDVENMDTLSLLQDGHGGIEQDMEQAIGTVGMVTKVDDEEDVFVYFSNIKRKLCFNPAALQKVGRADPNSAILKDGDLVWIGDNVGKIKALQEGHGGWIDDMEKTLGKFGRVKRIHRGGDVHVRVGGKSWRYNSEAVQKMQTPAGQVGMCDQGLHHWKSGVCKVCVGCRQCTAKGAGCTMKGKPLRPPGSPCGCEQKDGGCGDCGICRSCVGESSDDSSDDDAQNLHKLQQLGEAFEHLGEGGGGSRLAGAARAAVALSLLQLGQGGGLLGSRAAGLQPLLLAAMLGGGDDNDEVEEEAALEHGMGKGDEVKVEIDGETFRILQEEGGTGWNEEMLKVLGIPGTVSGLLGRNVIVQFVNGARWSLVPGCLTKVSSARRDGREAIKRSDLVKLIKDEEKLKELQKDHGGFNEDMQACLGKTGCVIKIQKRQVKVDFAGRRWWFNRTALTPALSEEEQETTHQLREGDYVKVDVDPETFKSNQLGHGGFVDKMKELVEEVGIVHHIDIDGDAVVYYPNNTRWCINPLNLGKVDPDECGDVDIGGVLEVGDWVKVDSDKDKIKRIQETTVKWDEGYYKAAGMVGRVKVTYPFNDLVRVQIKEANYPLNLSLIKKATPSDLKATLHSTNIKSPNFARGDLVKIDVTLDNLKILQEGHGGYVDKMEKVIGLIGCVSYIDRDGDINVRFSPFGLCFNPKALIKVKPTEDTFHVGDIVLIESDKRRLMSLQTEDHGGYNQKMSLTCGKTGRLLGVIESKKVRVKVQGRSWLFNPDLLTRLGNPGLGTGDSWKSATICSPGKHDWSKGRSLVCVSCGECTEFGNLCPARGRPDRYPGSFCGCGDGHAGCDDCGCCRMCAGEGTVEEDESDDDDKLKELLGTGLGGIFGEAVKEAVQELSNLKKSIEETPTSHADDHLPNEAGTEEERSERFYAALKKMSHTIELMRKSKGPDSIDAVKEALEKNFLIPYAMYDRRAEKKLMGDHLANIDAANVFMHYLTLLSSEATKSGSAERKLPLGCLELMRTLLIHYTDASSEFCRAVGRSGLISLLVQNLVSLQDAGSLEHDENLGDITRSMMTILYNCARVPETKDYFSDAGAVNLLKASLRTKDMDIKVTTLCCLAYIIDASELHLIRVDFTIADLIMGLLNAAISDPQHSTVLRDYSYSAMELVTTLGALARNDDNKNAFIRRGAVNLLITLIESGDEKEQECAICCIQRFALRDNIRGFIKNDSRTEEVLKVMVEHESRPVRAVAVETLHLLENGPKVTQDSNLGPARFSEVDYSDLTEGQFLGQGAFGKVFKAKHRVWMMDVAVKKLALRLSSNESLKRRLFDEASFMHRARHAFIVPLYGVCIDQHFTGLVMDFMENGSVEDLMKKVKHVPWALRWRILHETALGMNFLHSLDPRIIHHDLKVQNILLDEDFHAKITDFGVSEWKQRSKPDVVNDVKGSGIAGTITHMPPEHLQDPHLKAGKKFDVYSFGVVIWEVLTGQVPFQNAINSAHIADAVVHGQRPDTTLVPVGKNGPEELCHFDALMKDCWHQEPAMRPGFREIAERVEPVIQQTRTKVVEAVQTVLNALGKGAEKIPRHHSGKWDTGLRRNPGLSSEQQSQMENSGTKGIIQSFKKN